MSRRWGPFLCLYCGDGEPNVQPSVAHIFPDSIGGVSTCDDTTCVKCNGKTNRGIEQEAAKRLQAFRSMWGVSNRRGWTPKVDALVAGPDFAESIRVTDPSAIREVIARKRDGGGEPQYIVTGPADAAERRVAEIGKKRPDVIWRGSDVEVAVTVSIESEPDAPVFLRLATKIAFERLADLRGPTFVRDTVFDDAREFVLTGNSRAALAGCLADERWVGTGAPLSFPVPLHAVAVFAESNDRVLGAVVVLFGLYTYWVLLTDSYQGLEPWDDLLCENPITRATEHPLLRAGWGSLRLPWAGWRRASASSPAKVRWVVVDRVMRKLKASADAHYGPDDVAPHTT